MAGCQRKPFFHQYGSSWIRLSGTHVQVLELELYLEHYMIPQFFSIVDHIERTFNGKLNRKYYLTGIK